MGKDEARSGVPDGAVRAMDAAMSVARELPMTVETFLDWESRQEVKYEFDGFHTVAMTGDERARSSTLSDPAATIVSMRNRE